MCLYYFSKEEEELLSPSHPRPKPELAPLLSQHPLVTEAGLTPNTPQPDSSTNFNTHLHNVHLHIFNLKFPGCLFYFIV